jgi:hypothetical protein
VGEQDIMVRTITLSSLVLTLLAGSACTIKEKGSTRDAYKVASADSKKLDDKQDPESEACLQLAEQRKQNLQLLEDEEPTEETDDQKAQCPTDDATTGDDSSEDNNSSNGKAK